MISTKNIEQSVVFEGARPDDVYEALLDAQRFQALSGKEATISREIGGTVTAYGGFVQAIQIELIPGKRIVQAWKGGVAQWPKDHYSIVIFDIATDSKGTHLTFTQYGVPDTAYSIIDSGWPKAYWEPMKKYLSTGRT